MMYVYVLTMVFLYFTVMLALDVLIIIHHAHQWMDITLLIVLSVTITVYQMGMNIIYGVKLSDVAMK